MNEYYPKAHIFCYFAFDNFIILIKFQVSHRQEKGEINIQLNHYIKYSDKSKGANLEKIFLLTGCSRIALGHYYTGLIASPHPARSRKKESHMKNIFSFILACLYIPFRLINGGGDRINHVPGTHLDHHPVPSEEEMTAFREKWGPIMESCSEPEEYVMN